MKKLKLISAVAAISLLACFNAFAGEWKEDDIGWRYNNDDNTYATDEWRWINGTCYFFNSDGYCLMDTTTPDGYMVSGSGAWTVDGVVQTQIQQGQKYELGDLTILHPEGFEYDAESSGKMEISFDSSEYLASMVVMIRSKETGFDFEKYIQSEYHNSTDQSTVVFNGKTWTRSGFTAKGGVTYAYYNRYSEKKLYTVLIIIGEGKKTISFDTIMENYIK